VFRNARDYDTVITDVCRFTAFRGFRRQES
jgi:hypothetical protein